MPLCVAETRVCRTCIHFSALTTGRSRLPLVMPNEQNEINPIWLTAATIADRYRKELDAGFQRPTHTYSESLSSFDSSTPETGTAGLEVIENLAELAGPGIHAMTGSRFFGWVIGSSHEVGVAADWMTSSWGQNAGNHSAAPAASAAETVAIRWLLDILDLDAEASVGLVTGCTMANFVCLAAARGEVLQRLGWDVEAKGLFGAPPITVLLGDDAHSTVFSALQYLGLGRERVKRIPTNDQGAMLPDAFERVMKDSADEPAIIAITQAGQINTGAFDPHTSIITSARNHPNCWVHVVDALDRRQEFPR